MRRPNKKTTRIIVAILLSGAALSAPLFLGIITINITPSVPLGIWFIANSPPQKDQYAQVQLKGFKAYIKYNNYPFKKNPAGKQIPFIKQVAGVSGDLIEYKENRVIVNGIFLPYSMILKTDRVGRELPPFTYPLILKTGEIWLHSNNPHGFDSRYMGPASLKECKRAIPLLTWH